MVQENSCNHLSKLWHCKSVKRKHYTLFFHTCITIFWRMNEKCKQTVRGPRQRDCLTVCVIPGQRTNELTRLLTKKSESSRCNELFWNWTPTLPRVFEKQRQKQNQFDFLLCHQNRHGTWYFFVMWNGESRSSTCLQTSHWDCKGDTVHGTSGTWQVLQWNLGAPSKSTGIHCFFFLGILVSGDWFFKHWHSRRWFSVNHRKDAKATSISWDESRVVPKLVMKLWQQTGVARTLMNFGYPPCN